MSGMVPEPAGRDGGPQGPAIECECEHCGKRFEAVPIPQHRVLCADSTDLSAVERLMAGEKAGLLATDPPYGVAYDGNAHRREHGGGRVYDPIANDDLEGPALESFLTAAFRAASGVASRAAASCRSAGKAASRFSSVIEGVPDWLTSAPPPEGATRYITMLSHSHGQSQVRWY